VRAKAHITNTGRRIFTTMDGRVTSENKRGRTVPSFPLRDERTKPSNKRTLKKNRRKTYG
jgi:hypothetical protein